MRNLFAFFRRFQVFLVFAGLQIFCLSWYFTSLNFPHSQFLSTASVVNGKILETRNSFTKYWNLDGNNKNLQRENISLRNHQPLSFVRLQNQQFKIDDTLYQQQYQYISARVIHSTVNKQNNFFTLDIGKSQNIKPGMGVFTDNGIVGVIYSVSKHYSLVRSLLTENINVDVNIEESGAFGLLKWDGKNPRRGFITGISNDMDVKKWSKVTTRGGSGIFPRGLNVGKIETIETVEGKPIWKIVVLFGEDFRKTQNVYVVRNLFLEEQQKLELKPGQE